MMRVQLHFEHFKPVEKQLLAFVALLEVLRSNPWLYT